MVPRFMITFGILLYGVAVPILEINATHVFNPDWPPHARIHEVWQLTTNCAIGLFCLWQIWFKDNVRLPAVLGLMVTGGFLFAFAIQNTYGGSMKYLDGSEKTIFGLNIGLVGFGLVVLMTIIALLIDRTRTTGTPNP